MRTPEEQIYYAAGIAPSLRGSSLNFMLLRILV